MAIDRIIPRFLVADKDERLLEEGAMTDALNVSVTVNGDNTEGIIKTLRGTQAVSAVDGSAIGTANTHKCIGSVADSENGTIYWFVWGSNQDHQIVRYDQASDDYRVIVKASWLRFQETGFVKADIINISVPTQTDSTGDSPNQQIQTILYFTDNYNQPRKINVTRVLAGDFDNVTTANLDFAFNTIKAAPNIPCSFRFVTDTSYKQNKITGNTFQFAMQYIYKDGEESAISPYSKLAVSLTDIHTKLPETGSFVTPLSYNVCKVNIPLTQSIYDLKSVRLLARQGGETTFFVVDEFNPYEDKTDKSGTVYDSSTREYNFKNDRLLTAVSTTLVDKLYDNVPLKALGQAVSSDRLIYANYEEGRNNHDPEIRGFSFRYHSPTADITDHIDPNAVFTNEILESSSAINIDIDFQDLYNSGVIPEYTQNEISFKFRPKGSVTASSGNFIEAIATDPTGGPLNNPFPKVITSTSLNLGHADGTDPHEDASFSFNTSREYDMSVALDRANFKSFLENVLEDYTLTIDYDYGSSSSSLYTLLDASSPPINLSVGGIVAVDFKFDDGLQIDANGVVTLHPRVVNVDFSSATLSNGYSFGFGTVNSDQGSVPSNIADSESNQNWASETSYMTNPSITSVSNTYVSSFKAGSNHKFGIVYYDKYNRSGFVNELGTLYNKWYGERNGGTEGYGPSSFNLGFDTNPIETAPTWADRYQLVCTGPLEIDDYVQYTTGGGYPARYVAQPPGADGSQDGSPDKNKCQIYVNIDTLTSYKDEKNSLRDYSFTVGDKLRVVSRDQVRNYTTNQGSDTYDTTTIYPTASDGSIIEFDVVGVEVMTVSGQDILVGTEVIGNSTKYHGTFLVLEQPAIAAGATYTDGNGDLQSLKYDGFDFFSISHFDYRGSGAQDNQSSGFNYWGHNCVVEIYTPKKNKDEHVYYEIGESVRISTSPPAGLSTSAGSVHYRPIACKSPVPLQNTDLTSGANANDGDFNINIDANERTSSWQYFVRRLESNTASDYFSSKAWNAGRAHVVYEKAAQRRIRNGVTYSDAYVEDVENLALSSFNPSLANFFSLNHRFGPVNYISNYNDDLAAIQQNKFSLIPINKNVIQYSGGSSNVAISTDIFSKPQYSTGDFGCDHPESALVVDNDVYFVDASRRKVMRFAGGQLTPISDKDMQSTFTDFFDLNMDRFVSGYDPDDNSYYITGFSSSSPTRNATYSYNVDYGKWQSRCSFLPDFYGFVNNLMVSFIEDSGHIHTHDSNSFLEFYGGATSAYVTVVSKLSPSRVKTYNALSYEGDSVSNLNPTTGRWRVGPSAITTNLGTNTGNIAEADFKLKEGSMYASIPRTTSGVAYEEGNIMLLGDLDFQSDGSTLSNAIYLSFDDPPSPQARTARNLSRLPIPFNEDLTLNTTNGTFTGVKVKSVNKNKIVFDLSSATNTTSSSAVTNPNELNPGLTPDGAQIEFNAAINGDVVRGNWAKITLTTGSSLKTDLYCINTHVTDSKYHHALGEQ